MKKVCSALFFMVLFLDANSQKGLKEIKIGEAKDNVGDTVKICTKISDVVYNENMKGSPTWLHGTSDDSTNGLLTFVIWGEKRKNFDYKPEKDLKDRNVCITGVIELVKDKPTLVIERQSQIDIK